MANEVPPGLLELLCCPVGRDRLHAEDGHLVSVSLRRYPVRDGIPVLLPSGAEDAALASIVEAFRNRASSYYADNYAENRNPSRARRLQIVAKLLAEHSRPGERLLDVGAGPAILAEIARELSLDYVALDPSLENLLEGRERVGDLSGVVGTATALPIRDRSFDMVVALGCLEYVAELGRALSEICRVLPPDGVLLASFANAHNLRRRFDEAVTHRLWRLKERVSRRGRSIYRRHLWSEDDVRHLLAELGFSVQWIIDIDARVTPQNPGASTASEFLVVARKAYPGSAPA